MKDKKRIVFVANLAVESLGAHKGGRAFYNTLLSYIHDDWDVTLITSQDGIPESMKDKIRVLKCDVSEFSNKKSKFTISRKINKWRYVLTLDSYFKKLLESFITDFGKENLVIYAYEVWGVKAAKIVAEKYNLPLVTRFQGTVHANTPDNIINRYRYSPHLSALKTKADLVIMTNDGTQGLETLNRLGNKSTNIKFWMNGITIPPMPSDKQRDELRKNLGFESRFVFLTISRLVYWKRVDRAISAFSKIHLQIPNSELHIIGDGNNRENLEKMAKSMGLFDKIVFHGSIPQNDVFDYMIAGDVFLSLYDISNVGNPLLEAMSVGKPIITLNNGDTKMFVHNDINGILLDSISIDGISQKMLDLYSDKNYSRQLSSGARKYAEEHFWSWAERMSAEIIEVKKLFTI